MVKQVLEIRTTRARTELHSQKGGFVRVGRYGSHQSEVSISREPGSLTMEKTPARMDLNTIDVIDSIRRVKMESIVNDYAQAGKEQAMEATAKFARQGTLYMDPNVNGVLQSASDIVLEDADQTYGLTWMPPVQAQTEFTPEELNFHYTKERLSFDVRLGENEFDFQPGSVSTSLAQAGGVSVRYLGEPNYFPTPRQKFNQLV